MRKILLIIILLIPLIVSGKINKQFPSEQHEITVRLVLVDVTVTDKKGNFITDLTKEDFELYEDGKRVPINSIELISFGERRLISLKNEQQEKVLPKTFKKKLVVIFDEINSWQRNLKRGARKIVDELVALAKLGNEVMIALLNENRGLEIVQPFTTEEELIRRAIVKASGSIWLEKSLEAMKMYQEVGIEDIDEMAKVERYAEKLQPLLEQEYLFFERKRFEKSVGGLLTIVNMIKDVPGRKSILLISDGLPDLSSKTLDSIIYETTGPGIKKYDSSHLNIRREMGTIRVFDPFNILKKKKIMSWEEILREFIRFANTYNISIYTLDPDTFIKYLIPVSAEYTSKREMRAHFLRADKKIRKVQNLRWLSEDTGGISLIGATKYEKFYNVLSTNLNYYYLLSYYPPREKPDNKFHKIKVKVKRPGIKLRYRKGYIDYSNEEREKVLLVSAYYNPFLFKQLPFEAEFIPFYENTKKYVPWINIALPPKKLFIDRGIEFGFKKFKLYLWIKDKKMGEKAFGGEINIPFKIDSSFMEVIKNTDYLCFHYKGPKINLVEEEYHVIFALQDPQTNEIGTWESSFFLPDFEKYANEAIINCILGVVTPNPEKGEKSFSISKKDGALVYNQIRFFPSITNQFQRMQDAFIFLQVYLPKGKTSFTPKFKIPRGEGFLNIPAELIAEKWDKKSKIWNGIFKLNFRSLVASNYLLEVEISFPESGKILKKEIKFTKLLY